MPRILDGITIFSKDEIPADNIYTHLQKCQFCHTQLDVPEKELWPEREPSCVHGNLIYTQKSFGCPQCSRRNMLPKIYQCITCQTDVAQRPIRKNEQQNNICNQCHQKINSQKYICEGHGCNSIYCQQCANKLIKKGLQNNINKLDLQN